MVELGFEHQDVARTGALRKLLDLPDVVWPLEDLVGRIELAHRNLAGKRGDDGLGLDAAQLPPFNQIDGSELRYRLDLDFNAPAAGRVEARLDELGCDSRAHPVQYWQ